MQIIKKYSVNIGKAGFTFVEMLMTLALVAILIGIALPSYRSIMQNIRVSGITNDFVSTLSYARGEALKRDTPVAICAASNNTFSTCGSNANWANGWIVFVDANSDGVIASSTDILKTHDALVTGSLITTSLPYIIYNRSGFLGSNTGSLTITAGGCSGMSANLITLTITGRASVTSTACTIP
ncbi:MAG: GspH/FimT family pseudopilin [Gammaproteobacteria bacterium]|nr:GspH/FimT family pseudopilin [Gammaproteobacteria bacterium]